MYAKRPYYLVLYMQGVLILYCSICKVSDLRHVSVRATRECTQCDENPRRNVPMTGSSREHTFPPPVNYM